MLGTIAWGTSLLAVAALVLLLWNRSEEGVPLARKGFRILGTLPLVAIVIGAFSLAWTAKALLLEPNPFAETAAWCVMLFVLCAVGIALGRRRPWISSRTLAIVSMVGIVATIALYLLIDRSRVREFEDQLIELERTMKNASSPSLLKDEDAGPRYAEAFALLPLERKDSEDEGAPEWIDDFRDMLDVTRTNPQAIRDYFERHSTAIALARSVRDLPGYNVEPRNVLLEDPKSVRPGSVRFMSKLATFASLLGARAVAYAHEGDEAGAIDALDWQADVARHLSRSGNLLGAFYALAIAESRVTFAEEVLRTLGEKVSFDALRFGASEDPELERRLLATIESESALQRATIVRIMLGKVDSTQMLALAGSSVPTPPPGLDLFLSEYRRFYRVFILPTDLQTISRYEAAAREELLARDIKERVAFQHRPIAELGASPGATGASALRMADDQLLRVRTAERVGTTALAVHRYRIARGAYPQTLDGLVPDFLKSVPVDAIEEMPLRYERLEDGVAIVGATGDSRDAPLEELVRDETFEGAIFLLGAAQQRLRRAGDVEDDD
ncbi:MAG TPA: hypothetical protein VK116_01115 [Planctomycetota bacterium]|nr:hypothetical protein [Planctomycetota bacterium]